MLVEQGTRIAGRFVGERLDPYLKAAGVMTRAVLYGFLITAFVWGPLWVHPTDNVLRPLLISNAARVPFVLVMLGALGGLAAYGLVGVFIGPVLLGAAVAIWREWAAE